MQNWEYGYLYVVIATSPRTPLPPVQQDFFVLADVQGIRVLKDVSARLNALNILGNLGWIISEAPYTNWESEMKGWIFDLVKREKPDIGDIKTTAVHFMRRPRS